MKFVEEWKPVKGYENEYIVSNCGNVKGLNRFKKSKNESTSCTKERFMKKMINRKGYLSCKLSKNNIGKRKLIHRLVAEAFLTKPTNKDQVNHIDGNKLNNHVENLEWCNSMENVRHSIKLVLRKKHPSAKLNIEKAREIRISNLSNAELAKTYNVSEATIYDIRKNRTWQEDCWSRSLDDVHKQTQSLS